jgi:hypothetical protein
MDTMDTIASRLLVTTNHDALFHAEEGRPDPVGGLGNIFCNIDSPGMQGKVPTSEVKVKLLNPPPVLSNSTRLQNAYACASMSLRQECGSGCGRGAWRWEALWDDRIAVRGCPRSQYCSPAIKDLPGNLHEMARWHTYIVTENLEVHPSSVAKGMDLLRGVQYSQVIKEKRVVGSDEVLGIQPKLLFHSAYYPYIRLPSSIPWSLNT